MKALPLPVDAGVYRVGGSVRDELLNRHAKDADYVIRNVELEEFNAAVRSVGAKASKLSLRDGRVIGCRVAIRGAGLIEVVLPRTEISTGPRHTDFEIVCSPGITLAQDAERRDFTINALYRDIRTGEIIDPLYCGQDHLAGNIIEATHQTSFRDDPLRILRAARFASQLGFSISPTTYSMMRKHADAVSGLTDKGISGTAYDELCKILMSNDPATGLRLLADIGALQVLLPELESMIGFDQESKYHDLTTDEHTWRTLTAAAQFDAPLRVRLALLFHDCGKPEAAWRGDDGRLHYYQTKEHPGHEEIGAKKAKAAFKRLNVPARMATDCVRMIENHMINVPTKVRPAKVRQQRVLFGDEFLRDLYLHRLCDLFGKEQINYEHVTQLQKMEEVRYEAERMGVPCQPKDLPISGHDLMDIGFEGREIGKIQRKLLRDVAGQPKNNNRDWLLAQAEKAYRKGPQ